MAVTMADITKLRALTSAGLMDCKKALAETDGDIQAAVEILRKKGQAVAAPARYRCVCAEFRSRAGRSRLPDIRSPHPEDSRCSCSCRSQDN